AFFNPLSPAFSRAIRTASLSLSPASTGLPKRCQAAKARMPVPVPISSGFLNFLIFERRSSALTQPIVVSCRPVPKAMPASISVAIVRTVDEERAFGDPVQVALTLRHPVPLLAFRDHGGDPERLQRGTHRAG